MNVIDDRLNVLRARWENYARSGSFDQFVEFTIIVNSLTEYFNRMRLPGLVRMCEGLENLALARLGTPESHPISDEDATLLQRQIDTLLGAAYNMRPVAPRRRNQQPAEGSRNAEWIKPRQVWLVAAPSRRGTASALGRQIDFFGFLTEEIVWGDPLPGGDAPLAVLFMPGQETTAAEHRKIAEVRARYPASQMVYLGAELVIDDIVALMRSGIDITIPAEEGANSVLNCIFDLVQNFRPEKFRVLVVEDSPVAGKLIQRTLAENGIDSRAINDPGWLLEELRAYRPDLILMDMHMPRFNGVEATRALRQISAYRALPIVYLSSESNIGIQVEALRLGGDQFLNKPFNPVLLAAVVKTKIARYRESQHLVLHDGLTGLLNHTAAKSALKAMVEKPDIASLTVVMIDIDHFKSINDTYGHPVGDQVIRTLAWLLKGRLRSSDLIGRYGGEEFLVALPDITPAQAYSVIGHIREDFSSLPHVCAAGNVFSTFSAGVASWPDFTTAQGLTEAADFALLEAKQRGRNQIRPAHARGAASPAAQPNLFSENISP
ncbi:MAG: diguanylate cyclase [Candidatus Accumulibacter sp.]|jgi:diguanylate cyclase (GGDEF)-like protein|nr:diguanylate cyclase [Accumulibacter sp.]